MCYRHEGTTQKRVISPRLLLPADLLVLWRIQKIGGPTKWWGVNLKLPISCEMAHTSEARPRGQRLGEFQK